MRDRSCRTARFLQDSSTWNNSRIVLTTTRFPRNVEPTCAQEHLHCSTWNKVRLELLNGVCANTLILFHVEPWMRDRSCRTARFLQDSSTWNNSRIVLTTTRFPRNVEPTCAQEHLHCSTWNKVRLELLNGVCANTLILFHVEPWMRDRSCRTARFLQDS